MIARKRCQEPFAGNRPSGCSAQMVPDTFFSACLAILLLATCLSTLAVRAVAAEQSDDQQFLAGLRERGLYQLAETYCLDRLADPQLAVGDRARLVIEMSLSLADRAINSAPGERGPLWERSGRVVDEFVEQVPDSPLVALVRLQAALAILSRGELARQEAQVVTDNQGLIEEARSTLRIAIRRLNELAEDVANQLRGESGSGRPSSAADDAGRMNQYQLVALQKNVRYQLARALRNQGESYEPDSADRANSLTQAAGLLNPLAGLEATDPLAWKSRIDEIVCYRLLAEYATAARKLDALVAAKPPPQVALEALAQRIELVLAIDRLDEAVKLLLAGRELQGANSPKLDYAWLQTFLEAWRAAAESGDQQTAAGWQTKATEMVRLIERLHGPYWMRRAEMLLAGYVQASPGGGDLDMRVRAAESSYRSGQFDEALSAYDGAQSLARQQGDQARAFELGYVAAAIQHTRNRHPEAMRRYRELALAMTDNPKASQAHALAIYHAQQIARSGSPQSLDDYVGLLEEHLENWPGEPTAQDVRLRLGKLREHQRNWPQAIEAYRAVSPGSDEFSDAVESAGRCWRSYLDQRLAASEPVDRAAAEAAAWFESLVLGPQQRMPEKLSPVARSALLTAAGLWLNYTDSGFDRAERLLSAALSAAPDAPPEWKSTAKAMLVFCLAGQGRRQEAADALKQISTGTPDQLLDLLKGLSRVAAAARPEVKAELAQLELQAIELLLPRRSDLDQSGQRSLDHLKAQALADAGRTDEALDAFRWLANVHTRDGEIQESYARLLSGKRDRRSLQEALLKWRELEKKSQSGSERWFRAKYEVALLHYRLGDRQQAEKIISLLAVLHPELGGPAMKPRFTALLDRCKAPGP